MDDTADGSSRSRVNFSLSNGVNGEGAMLSHNDCIVEFQRVVETIFLQAEVGSGENSQGCPDLLEKLDHAFYEYKLKRYDEIDSHQGLIGLKSALNNFASFIGVDGRRFSVGSGSRGYDANFSDSLAELQLNWCETLDAVNNLLDLDAKGSLVSLALANQNIQNKRATFHEIPVRDFLPEHT